MRDALRLAGLAGAGLLAACAARGSAPAAPAAMPADSRSARYIESAEADGREALGDAILAEVRAADTSVLVRRSVSLPRMTQQPDGSWKPEGPHVSAAVRTRSGWVHLTRAGRYAFDAHAGRELDRLIGLHETWEEPVVAAMGCTDPGGPTTVIRRKGSIRVSLHPCGTSGLTGNVAGIVMAGRVADWSGVPQEGRPAGIALTRFDESIMSYFRHSSALREPVDLQIRRRSEWDGLWRRATANHGNVPHAPQVDFGREMLLVAGYGLQPTGGFSIVIDRVLETPYGLEVHVRRIAPGPRCGTTAALTSPVDIVRIPASDAKLHWVINEAMSDCP
jgi:hypothetical protein